MIRWFTDHFDEMKRRMYSSYHLRGTIHGTRNYVHGKPEIVDRSKFVLGSNCHINSGTYINASNGVVIGDDVTLSANCFLVSTGIDYKSWICGKRAHISGGGGVRIGNHVWIGANAIILPGVSILGEYVIIAAGAVVTKSIYEGFCIYAGNPARKIKEIQIPNCNNKLSIFCVSGSSV